MPFVNINATQPQNSPPSGPAAATPVSLPEVKSDPVPDVSSLPTVEITPAEVVMPQPVIAATATTEVLPTPVASVTQASPVTEVNLATEANAEVVSFTSTADADDPDKPADISSPQVKVTEGTEIKAQQSGIREIVGPSFDNSSTNAQAKKDEESNESKSETSENTAPEKATEKSESVPQKVDVMQPNDIDVKATMGTDADEEVTGVNPENQIVIGTPADAASLPAATVDAPLDITALPALPAANSELSALAADLTASKPKLEGAPAAPNASLPTPSNDNEPLASKTYSLNELLAEAINMHASDLHLSVGYRAMARVDGKLIPIKSNVFDQDMIKVMVKEVIGNRGTEDLDSIKDYDLAYKLADGSARFRVNIFRQQDTLGMVLRLIPTQIQTIEALKLPPIVKEFTKFSSGLVLFTGPTGSGKSTTIASLLNLINMSEPKHIITIEDPVEYVYPKGVALVDQRQIFNDTESWGDALRSVLREDPDIVLIGEMRDLETISSAIRVAETGHLVFATLHTNTAAQSIDRIIDVFPEGQQAQIRTQLASVLQAVVSQRLVPITGGGRRAAAEVLIATAAVRNAVRDDKVYQIDNMIQTSAELGMVTLEKSLVGLVREGLISIEQAQMYSNKPADILTLLGQNK